MISQLDELSTEELEEIIKEISKKINLQTGCKYEDFYCLAIEDNIVDFDLEDKDTVKKINSWAEKFGYSYEEVTFKIKNDEMFATFFIKEPARQNIYERVAFKYLEPFFDKDQFIKLPASGHGAIYLNTNGTIEKQRNKFSSKSIDFYGIKKCKEFYITHKHTKGCGGAQDNQLIDVCIFLTNAMKNNEPNKNFVAILDGNYYTSKFEELRKTYKKDNVFIFTIEEFVRYITEC